MQTFKLILTAVFLNLLIANAQVSNTGFELLNSNGSIQYWGHTFLRATEIDSNGVSDSFVIDKGFCFASANAHSGSNAMEMRNAYNFTRKKGVAGGAFYSSDTVQTPYSSLVPFSSRPSHFNFYYKYYPVNKDTANAIISIYNINADLIGSAFFSTDKTSSKYTYASIPFSYSSSDSAALISIHFLASSRDTNAQLGTRFIVDDISFSSTSGIKKVESPFFSVVPNPTQGIFSVSSIENTGEIRTILINSTGQIVIDKTLNTHSFEFNIQHLPAGIYELRMISKDQHITVQKLIKQ